MAQVSDIINAAFERLGVIRPGETITGSLQSSAFLALQQRWALNCIEEAFSTQRYHQTFTMVAGTAVYTVAPSGGTLTSTVAPVRIVSWRSVSGSFESSGQIISFEEFEAKVQNPNGESAVLAKVVAADGGFPLKTIRVFPVPATSPGSLILDYYGVMTQFSTVGDSLAFAPGYENFLVNDLAIELYPQYARAGAQSLQALAANRANALGVITALNAKILGLQPAQPQQAA